MKYIVCRVLKKRHKFMDVPIIFPELVSHDLMFAGAKSALLEQYPASDGFTVKALSAGFMSSLEIYAECYGSSTTLGIKSRGDADSKLISKADYGGCLTG